MQLRLAFVLTHPLTATHLLRGQLAHLQSQGFTVRVFCAPGPELGTVEQREGVETVAVPMVREIAPWHDLRALLALRRELASFAPHIVNAGTPKAGLLGSLAAASLRVPVRVYTLRGLRLETTRGMKRQILKSTERLAARSSHRVVCVSESLRQRFLELGLGQADKAMVLGSGASNGVDVEHFRRAAEDHVAQGRLRAELGLTDDSPVVGFVGRLTRDKGLPELQAAFEDLRREHPELRLLVLGEEEPGDPLPEETRRWLHSDPAVLRPGFVADPAPYYPLMRALAFPSYREGFPNVPLEAAAAGRPVVGFQVTGTVDAVCSDQTGQLVPRGDAEALSRAIGSYLDRRHLAIEHGRAGQQRVAEEFSNEIVWQRWVHLYRHLWAQAAEDPSQSTARSGAR